MDTPGHLESALNTKGLHAGLVGFIEAYEHIAAPIEGIL